MPKSKKTTPTFRLKSGAGTALTLHTSPFIDKYTAFLQSKGRFFDNLAEFKNREYMLIRQARMTMLEIPDTDLIEAVDTYIRLHRLSELTHSFIYPTPAEFFKHYFQIVSSKEFKKEREEVDVSSALSDPQVVEQIHFLLSQLTISWGEHFPPQTQMRVIARSFAVFDKFTETEEFRKLPDSMKAQFSRYQTVRNYYRFVELNPQIIDIKKSPVLSFGYLRSIIKQHRGD